MAKLGEKNFILSCNTKLLNNFKWSGDLGIYLLKELGKRNMAQMEKIPFVIHSNLGCSVISDCNAKPEFF